MANNPRDKRAARRIVYTNPKQRIKDHEKGWTPTAFKVPEGMQKFRFTKEKTYRLTIVPFVAGEGNPHADAGSVHFERTYYVHNDIGPEENTYCCLQRTFDKPCPVCQQAAIQKRAGTLSEDGRKAMMAKERQLWLVIDHDERDKGVQLMECAYYGKGTGFGEMLDNKLDAADEDHAYQRFFHLGTAGMTLVVKVKPDSFMGRTFYKPSNMELEPRRDKDAVAESLLDTAPCLDDLPIEMDYDEYNELFLGNATPPSGDDTPPTDDAVQPDAESTEAEAEAVEEANAEEETGELEVGCTVEFMLGGKMTEAEVTELVEEEGKAKCKVTETGKLYKVKFDDLTIVKGADNGDPAGDDDAAGGDVEPGGDEPEAEPEGAEEDEGADGEGDQNDAAAGEEDEDAVIPSDDDLPFDPDDEAPVEDEEPAPPPPPVKPKAPPKPTAKPAAKAPPAKPAPKPAAKAPPPKKPAGKK